MGVVDFLKKLFPPGESELLAMEPQCVRHMYLTLHLPTGWRFTNADVRNFKASGPGGCAVEFFLAGVNAPGGGDVKADEFEENHKGIVRLVSKHFLEGKSAAETILPTGVLWMEASDIQGQDQRLRIALLNPRSRNGEWVPPMLQVTCTIPGASGGEGFVAERFEALRTALRSAEWN